MARFVMIMDTRRCIGCHSCTVACKVNNALPVDMIYCPVFTDGPNGVFPHVSMTFYPLICMHCQDPPCVGCCPTGASQQDADGIVWVDQDTCIGCKACIQACPYHARHENARTGTVQKCDFCKERVREGLEPFCVETCHQRARIFGDLDDPESAVSKMVKGMHTIQLLPEIGTDPQVYYIIAPGSQA